MDWSKDNDPHGVQRLLAMLRTQQDPAPTGSKPVLPSAQTSSSAGETLSELVGADDGPVEGREDVRYISFAQALPHLTRLSRNEAFLSALLRLKAEQDRYERTLAEERTAFATSKGTPSHPALDSWDREALRRWDVLHSEQQTHLQAWGVPCFFETSDPAHLTKQSRVFDVLHGLLE